MDNIEIFNISGEEFDELDDIIKFVEFVVKKEKLENSSFNVIFVNNEEIRKINIEYRGFDKETDVISFALEDFKFEVETGRILGDIYISVDKAREQALLYEHSFLRELAFLTVHGIYHLLGFSHDDEKSESEMLTKQEEVLLSYGIER